MCQHRCVVGEIEGEIKASSSVPPRNQTVSSLTLRTPHPRLGTKAYHWSSLGSHANLCFGLLAKAASEVGDMAAANDAGPFYTSGFKNEINNLEK